MYLDEEVCQFFSGILFQLTEKEKASARTEGKTNKQQILESKILHLCEWHLQNHIIFPYLQPEIMHVKNILIFYALAIL